MPIPIKSVFDGVEIDDKAFPLDASRCEKEDGGPTPPRALSKEFHKQLVIVSYCRTCSSPIYGEEQVRGDETPIVKFTCSCRLGLNKSTNILDTMSTK